MNHPRSSIQLFFRLVFIVDSYDPYFNQPNPFLNLNLIWVNFSAISFTSTPTPA